MKNHAIKPPEWLSKSSVYQINPRTFSKEGTIKAIIKELHFIKSLGFNILYLCPIFEEDANDDLKYISPRQLASKTGNPKNPYRMNDYFNIDEEYGTTKDLKELIEEAHALGMKVLLDMVYAHIGPNAPILKKHPEFAKQNEDGTFMLTRWNFAMLDFRSEGLREFLYCNMVYYIAVLDADGFRLDVGDEIPVDFWKEARRRIHTVKEDAVLINEGSDYEKLTFAFDSAYCFEWHNMLREVYCDKSSATEIRSVYNEDAALLPLGSVLLRDIDNHDTVTDWNGRTETVATHDGMEQIEVLNFLIDGIPMVYSGNELACTKNLNMFANRFYMGEYEVTDRTDKKSSASIRRQEIIKTLNHMKSESDLLRFGKTLWIDTSCPDNIIAFKRVLNEEEIIFIGNTKSEACDVEISELLNNKNCILSNGKHQIKDNVLHLNPYEYAVFE